MANYSLVVNSKFQPFSFERYIQPYQIYGQNYREIENALGELDTKASIWEGMANAETDPYAYKMYKTYANDLEEQAGQLAREGLNAASRKDMLNMRARYSKEITPIEQAYTTRQKQAEQQQQALLQDPTLMLSRRAATTSLDDYIRNPQLAYDAYSGKLITAQAANAASALAKEMQEKPRKWRSILGNSYYETMMQKGFSSQAVLQAIQDNPSAAPQLTKIVENAVNSSGVRDWGDQATIARAIDYAKQGLWSAIGETQYQTLKNEEYLNPLQRLQKKQLEQSMSPKINNLAINPLNIYSNRELNEAEKGYNDAIKKYSKYFYKDKNGQTKMTNAGWQEYNRKNKVEVKNSTGLSTEMRGNEMLIHRGHSKDSSFEKPSDFRLFMDSIGAKGNSQLWQPGNLGNIWNKYISSEAKTGKYDTTKVTEYDYSITGSQQDSMKDAIMTAGRGLSLKEVDYDNKSKKFKDTGKEITMEDLKDDKYKVTATRFSPYGATVIIQDDKGNVRRYRMPAGINTTNEQNRDRAMTAANQWQQVVSTGQYTDARGNVHQATPDEITYAQQQYAQAIQQAYLFHSQLGVQNKTKEQEFNPYGY